MVQCTRPPLLVGFPRAHLVCRNGHASSVCRKNDGTQAGGNRAVSEGKSEVSKTCRMGLPKVPHVPRAQIVNRATNVPTVCSEFPQGMFARTTYNVDKHNADVETGERVPIATAVSKVPDQAGKNMAVGGRHRFAALP